MSSPDDIDALVVARRVLASPKTFRLSTHETLAMAGCLVGLDEQLDAIEAGPTTNARLAAALAAFFRDHRVGLERGAIADHSLDAFHALKTIFEEEFPNDASV